MKEQKIALVTGGSRGIGRASALHLARRGFDVVITYRKEAQQAQALVDEVRQLGRKGLALPLDVADFAVVKAFPAALTEALNRQWSVNPIHALVNNAGVGAMGPFALTTEEQFDQLFLVHVKSVFFLTQGLVPLLADSGAIVNVSTGLTRSATPGAAAYASAKSAVEVLTKYMAKELGERGIRANVVAPGLVDTEFGGGPLNPQIKGFVASQTALGRVATADDIAKVIATLCDDDIAWVTGQRIEASGGMAL